MSYIKTFEKIQNYDIHLITDFTTFRNFITDEINKINKNDILNDFITELHQPITNKKNIYKHNVETFHMVDLSDNTNMLSIEEFNQKYYSFYHKSKEWRGSKLNTIHELGDKKYKKVIKNG
jgi:hypothetical protein